MGISISLCDSFAVSSFLGQNYKWHQSYCLDEELENIMEEGDKSIVVKR